MAASLRERRIVVVHGALDDDAANRLVSELMSLDALSAERVWLHVDTTGESLPATLTVLDAIAAMQSEVHAHCTGRVEGPPVALIACAAGRTASPFARFWLREAVWDIAGTAEQLTEWAASHLDLAQRWHLRLAQATGQPIDVVADDLARGRVMTAEQALDYGIIDRVTGPAGRP